MAHVDAKRRRLLNDATGDAASLESVRRALAERLRARRSEIEEAIFARFGGIGFDSAEGEDAQYVAGARAAVTEVVGFYLTGIEGGERWSGSIPPALAAQARRAARNGVRLRKVLLRYNTGHAVLADFAVQEVEHSDLASQRLALRHVLHVLGALHDQVTSLGVAEFQQELEREAHSPERRRMERVQRMLAGGRVESAELGYELDAWHLGVIATGTSAKQTVQRLAAGLGRELLSVSRGEQTVWGWLGGRCSLASTDIERLPSVKEPGGVSLAVGEPGKGFDGWRLTHRQAQAAMLIALRGPQTRFTRFADVALLAAVLRDEEFARSLVQIHLSPLKNQRDGGAVARETLRAYFAAGCNAATAAAALGVARHTIERRLRTVEEMLGHLLRTRRPELEVALLIDELDDLTRLSGDSRSLAR